MGSEVRTQQGVVRGFTDQGLQVFRGIPFAKPPVGERRFRSPEAPESWEGIRDAHEFGNSAPQRDLPIPIFPGWDVGPQSEDCLYLNVTTPGADAGQRPVMVWIHGGGFTLGSGSQSMYDVRALVERGDVVVVSINYRLGPLGFLHLNDLLGESFGATGNAGIEDQVAALRWVRDNIGAFGGDPDNVTIFGESAGGMSVGTLLGTPSAAGLFHRAVPQSGAAHNVHDRNGATAVARRVMEELKVTPESVQQIRELPAEALLQAHDVVFMEAVSQGMDPLLPFQPVVDGRFLPKAPLEAVAEGLSARVALMVGSTRDEWNLLGMMNPNQANLDEAEVLEHLERAVGANGKRLLETYRAARSGSGATSPRDLYFAIESDRVFRIPGLRLAEAHRRHQPLTFQYLFTWESPTGDLGACHGIDIPFVFGSAGSPEATFFAGATPEAKALSERVMDAWLAFARSGDPNGEGGGEWPSFDADRRATMLFGRSCEVVDAPMERERCAWDGLI